VLAGAGLSTESGIPDFRSPGGQWTRTEPVPIDAFVASEAARMRDWQRRFDMMDQLASARPNAGHRAIRKLSDAGRLALMVTQNIDGLDRAAGIPVERLVEIHGTAGHAHCLDCGRRAEMADCRRMAEETGRSPKCEACGGLLKAAVVSFGEALPAEGLRRAVEAAEACDAFLCVGSSLVVRPAADLPLIARRAGARLAILNRDPTPLDNLAHAVFHRQIGTLLDAAVNLAAR
jgi:NAD-dependent deacetylase